MQNREHLARAMWTLFEPVHAITYFSTEARDAFAAIGLPRYWDGYFAGRAAPLGAVEAAPVTAMFSGFAPALVERALPAVWAVASPAQVLEARLEGAASTLRALVGDDDLVTRAADALEPVALAVQTDGRPLGAANRAQPLPTDPYRRLWQAAATLREHRGDGHVLALAAEEIGGLAALVLRSGVDMDAANMRRVRGWSEDEWMSQHAQLVARGLLTEPGTATAEGAAALNRAEAVTNRLAAAPWTSLTDAELLAVAEPLAQVARATSGVFPFPNPIGMPRPWNPLDDPEASTVPAVPAPEAQPYS